MSKKKKVFQVTSALGGVGVYIENLYSNIDSDKFEQVLVYNFDEKLFGSLNKMSKLNLPLTREISFKNDLQAVKQLIQYIKTEKPDLIHAHSSKAGIIGRLASQVTKTPLIYSPHSYYYLGVDGMKRSFFKGIEKYFSSVGNSTTLACSTSEFLRSTEDLKISKKKVLQWNNSTNDINSEYNKDGSSKPFIVTLARPSKQKNLILMLRAFAKIRQAFQNIKLKIIGVGFHSDQLELVEKFIDESDLKEVVELIEWKERNEILQEIKNAELYLSTAIYEGLPYSIIEAMCLGKATVATNCDGNRDLIRNQVTGFLTDFNEEEISKKVLMLLTNEDLKEKMGANAYQDFKENFDIKKNIQLLEDIYFSKSL